MHPQVSELGSNSEMPLAWYAVYTRHQHEKSTAQILNQKGFSVLLPLYRSLSRWKDRNREVHLPLFSGYVFILAELDQKVEILRTPGVCWFVSTAGRPSSLPPHEIESIRRLTEQSCQFHPCTFLSSGDRVRVRSGPLVDMEGILVRVKNQHRLIVSVTLLSQSASVEIDSNTVEKIGGPLSQTASNLCASQFSNRVDGNGLRQTQRVLLNRERARVSP
jgi:transcription antitermination factor NusG